MRLELIVFDWDGTLMDSEARIVACIQAAFADIGEPPPAPAAARDVIGLGLEEAMATLWPSGSATQRSAIVARYRAHFLGGGETPSALFPAALATLSWLRERGFLLAVATGKSRRGLDQALAATRLRDTFHATRCADETFSKPHPEMLEQIMAELGVAASATLMVGDTEYDMQMARNAGTWALAVSYGVHEAARLLAHRPLGCLESLAELPRWLEQASRAGSRPALDGTSGAVPRPIIDESRQ